jgi:hypothetical protein
VVNARARQKIRAVERGEAGVRARLVALGAHPYDPATPPDGWRTDLLLEAQADHADPKLVV